MKAEPVVGVQGEEFYGSGAAHPSGGSCMIYLFDTSSLCKLRCISGTVPEKIPPAELIKEVEKRLKNVTPKLELDNGEAGDLLGEVAKIPREGEQ